MVKGFIRPRNAEMFPPPPPLFILAYSIPLLCLPPFLDARIIDKSLICHYDVLGDIRFSGDKNFACFRPPPETLKAVSEEFLNLPSYQLPLIQPSILSHTFTMAKKDVNPAAAAPAKVDKKSKKDKSAPAPAAAPTPAKVSPYSPPSYTYAATPCTFCILYKVPV